MKKYSLLISVFFLLSLGFSGINSQEWKPVGGNIMTPWAASVTPENVWKEYPRPQMVRSEWKNLNGLWDFTVTLGSNTGPAQRFNRKILVPFCVESALSGIKESITGFQEMKYRRLFTIPENWKGKRILLHFEAVDYYARLWIDGKFAGEHKGGYDAFQFDITDFLRPGENHEINMVVWDPSNTGTQPAGKQTLQGLSRGRYTPTSGIWQTVWLEPVGNVSVKNLKITPDIDKGTLTVEAGLKGWGQGYTLKIQASDKGNIIATETGVVDNPVILKINNPKLWNPESPYLYDLKVSLSDGDKIVDEVTSYFGMRKISIARDATGMMHINLNNKKIFQLGPLDQGYWPDGILTPPSDEALKFDVEYLKKIGCNMDRVHIKVQPDRFYYHCDKLGILIWQDMVSPWSQISRSDVGGAKAFEAEWETIIDQLYSHPSIIQWTVFNEGWVQYDTERLTEWTKRKDPSRIVSNASGWIDRNVGDIRDFHDYTMYPSVAWVPKYYPRAMVLGEGGGIELPLKGNLWTADLVLPDKIDRAGDVGRETTNTKADFEERYKEWIDNLSLLINYGLDGVVFTQISDVENEINGWLTYDRKISKIPEDKLGEIHSKLFKPVALGNVVLPLSMNSPQQWQYSFSEPGKDWFKKGNAGKWNSGNGPFGKSQVNAPEVGTKWEERSLYLQKDFNIPSPDSKLAVIVYSTGITDIYINGEFALQLNNLKRQDAELKVSEVILPVKALKLLKSGSNHIAVKFEFNTSDQSFNFFDFGLKSY
jgi:beta-galactosidase/beta-glucuronidase